MDAWASDGGQVGRRRLCIDAVTGEQPCCRFSGVCEHGEQQVLRAKMFVASLAGGGECLLRGAPLARRQR